MKKITVIRDPKEIKLMMFWDTDFKIMWSREQNIDGEFQE